MTAGQVARPGAQYAGKTVMVLGAARSGTAAAELLLSLGAKVLLCDQKPQEALGALPAALSHPDCRLLLGQSPRPYLPSCDLLVISPGIPLSAPDVAAAGEAGVPVTGELAFAASCAAQELIALSGTNGKTTTVSLLGEIFRQAGRVAHVAGNIGYPLSLAVLNAGPEDLLIAEVSSFQLETAGSFHPAAAAMLNLTPDHLDRHGTMDAYAGLKRRLFSNMGPTDLAVLNRDDPRVRAMRDGITARAAWFSSTQPVDEGALLRDGWICVRYGGEEKQICAAMDLRIPGRHNLENALAAAALAAGMQVPSAVIAYALRHFQGVEHRIEFSGTRAGVRYYNDSKGTNPDSTEKAIQAMSAPTVLILGGYDKHVPFDALARCAAGSGLIRHAVLIGQTAGQIGGALREAGFTGVTAAGSLEEAVRLASGLAKPGENVLFSPACASFDMFDDYEHRGRVFKRLVQDLPDAETHR